MKTVIHAHNRQFHQCDTCGLGSYNQLLVKACERIGTPEVRKSPRSLVYIACQPDFSGNEMFRLYQQGGELRNDEMVVRAKIQEIRTRGCAWGGKPFELRHFTEYLCCVPPRKTSDEESLVFIPDYTTIVRGYYDLN